MTPKVKENEKVNEDILEDHIVVRGAREHNLCDIDVIIPRNKLVVFTGVSGAETQTKLCTRVQRGFFILRVRERIHKILQV